MKGRTVESRQRRRPENNGNIPQMFKSAQIPRAKGLIINIPNTKESRTTTYHTQSIHNDGAGMQASFLVPNVCRPVHDVGAQIQPMGPIDEAALVAKRIDEGVCFVEGEILVASIDEGRNLEPLETSLSTHMLPCTRDMRRLESRARDPFRRIPRALSSPSPRRSPTGRSYC